MFFTYRQTSVYRYRLRRQIRLVRSERRPPGPLQMAEKGETDQRRAERTRPGSRFQGGRDDQNQHENNGNTSDGKLITSNARPTLCCRKRTGLKGVRG